jgi:hypothetical protein
MAAELIGLEIDMECSIRIGRSIFDIAEFIVLQFFRNGEDLAS